MAASSCLSSSDIASADVTDDEGGGESTIDGATLAWGESDTFVAPTHATIRLTNGSSKSPTFLFVVDDAPLHRKLGIYELFG